jgi:hypothetical protein
MNKALEIIEEMALVALTILAVGLPFYFAAWVF